MAENPIKYSDVVKKDKSIQDLIDELLKLDAVHDQTSKNINARATKVADSMKKVSGATNEQRIAIEKAAIDTQALTNAKENLRKAEASTAAEIANLKAAQQKQNAETKLTEQLNRSLEGSYNRLAAQYGLNKIQLNAMSEAERKNTAEGRKLETQTRKIYEEMNRLQQATGKSQLQVGRYTAALGSARAMALKFAAALGFTSLIYILVGLFKSAAQAVKEFDEEMFNMAGIAQTTRANLANVEAEIRKVAKSSINTAVDVAKTATALFALGKTDKEIVRLLKPVNNLAIALKAQADQAGELLIQTLNAFGRSAESAQEFADIIAKIRTSTALDFERIKDSLGYLAPVAKAVGLSFERTGAILGVLVDNGIQASRAGRLMSSSFSRLNAMGKTLDQALIELSTSTDKTGKATELFGTESFALGLILADNVDKIDAYDATFQKAAGTLEDLTNTQLKAVSAEAKITASAWTEFVLSIENGDGAISKLIKGSLRTLTDMLTYLTFNATGEDVFKGLIAAGLTATQIVEGLNDGTLRFNDATEAQLRTFLKEKDAFDVVTEAMDIFAAAQREGITNYEDFVAVSGEYILTTTSAADKVTILKKVQSLYNVELDKTVEAQTELEAGQIKVIEQYRRLVNASRDFKTALTPDEIKALAKAYLLWQKTLFPMPKAIYDIQKAGEEAVAAWNKTVEDIPGLSDVIFGDADKEAKNAADALARERDFYKARADQQFNLSLSEIDLLNTSEGEKTRLRLEAEKARFERILAINAEYNGLLSSLEIEAIKNTIKLIENEIAGVNNGGFDLIRFLGIDEEQAKAISDGFSGVISGIRGVTEARLQAANERAGIANQELNDAQKFYDEQRALAEKNETSSINRAERELNRARRNNERALKEQEKAQKAQSRLDSIQQGTSLLVASANIFKSFTAAFPVIGAALAVPVIAAMFGAFAVQKVRAKKLATYGDGGEFDISGGSHASGNDVSLGVHNGVERRVEGGEKAAVFSRKAVSKYGSSLSDVIKAINAGKFNEKYGGAFSTDAALEFAIDGGAGGSINLNPLLEENRKLREELKETVANIPQPIWNVGRTGINKSVRIGGTTYKNVRQENSWGE